MKKYVIKILAFFAIVALVDIVIGKIGDYLRDHTKGGFTGNVHYICEQCNEDIILMGSSRMKRHYVPQVFEDSLGMTCYNAGINGNGIILNYGFFEMILQRYSPKLIIYDVSQFDMYMDDNHKYLANLRAYFNKPNVSAIFYNVDAAERWKMISGMYRYNSNLLSFLSDNLSPLQGFEKGYWPNKEKMDYEPEIPRDRDMPVVDSLKIAYLHEFIALARNHSVPLIFVASPTWFGSTQQHLNDPIKKVCEEEGILFINDYYDVLLCSNKDYWADATHLNDYGARVYSREIIKEVRQFLKDKQNYCDEL